MTVSNWSDADTDKALDIWAEYERQNDLTERLGQTAGVDPASRRIWFGNSAKAIWRQMAAEGIDTPLYYVRVGSKHYVRKGGHR